MGINEEVDYEVCVQPDEPNSHCGKIETFDYYCGFHQPHVSSPVRKPNMSSNGGIAESWILHDSQSTIDVFSNPDILVKIHKVNTTLRIRCNAGIKTTEYKGYLTGYGWVWYYSEGIANILSLSRVKDRPR